VASLTFDDVFATLARIVASALRVDPATITPETNLVFDLNAESIDLVDIRFRIEEAYEFHIDQRAFIAAIVGDLPGDVGALLTMRRLTDFVIRQKNGVSI
jgi:acyl carrier protein